MKDIVEKMLDHPLATIFIISAAFEGVAIVVNAARGKYITRIPTINISSDKKD
jgi:hypothetical protein